MISVKDVYFFIVTFITYLTIIERKWVGYSQWKRNEGSHRGRSTEIFNCSFWKKTLMALTHVSIKGQNLNFYLETHATTHNIYFIRLRVLPRNLVHYTGVWMTLKESGVIGTLQYIKLLCSANLFFLPPKAQILIF